ncbi:hypothetical protein IEE92_09110 [Kocuria sp. cx-116]|uniref:hypothetical protein n=1 Tax=Kocuria sp. cx-116 TaxID=2771378 RepID=UPI0016879A48|nr:hypothetical protein [Kocuria sp. cx-116]MBD2762706.1 hypothetical protein [Kocuria sp. cx-116]
MGQIQVSDNTIRRQSAAHDPHGSRAATILTTMVTLLILVALGALVLHYVANARPQVATAAPAPHSLAAVHYPAQAAAQS